MLMAQRADYTKMSSLVRRAVIEQKDTRLLAPSRSYRSPSICAFVKIDQDADQVLQDNHCLKLAQFGNIYIASIPMSRLASLSLNSHVTRIEAGERCTALMDTTHIVNHIDPVYEGYGLPQAYTGSWLPKRELYLSITRWKRSNTTLSDTISSRVLAVTP